MSDKWAKPGDTIEIVKSIFNRWLGRRFVVIGSPEGDMSPPGSVWVREDDPLIPEGYFTFESYKIVNRAGEDEPNISDDVDKSLKRQLNNNLRGVFT